MSRLAGRAAGRLPHGAGPVVQFLRGRRCPDGGFRGRSADSDLYYTAFAVHALSALSAELPTEPLGRYLDSFAGGDDLDLVHLACLARCRAVMPGGAPRAAAPGIAAAIERCRSADGGYAPAPGADRGTAYACFLALGALQDLGAAPARPEEIAACLESLQVKGGAFANDACLPMGMVPATTAAVVTLRHLGRPPRRGSLDWLLARRRPDGGFAAAEGLAESDLLSTATSLFALRTAGADLTPLREDCAAYVLALHDSGGGFRDRPADGQADCEYAFYALLALGALEQP